MDIDTIDTTDPIERGELAMYINNLCEQIDVLEDMIQWLIANNATVSFRMPGYVLVTIYGTTIVRPTLIDAVEAFRERF